MDMLVSVVIPAYNESKYIEIPLKGLSNQTFKDFEIIVADNNSTDNTIAIARKYGARVINVPQQGAVFAYNGGMNEAKGEIIVNIDADTQPPTNWLETIVNALKPHDVVAVTGTAQLKTSSKMLDEIWKFLYTLFIGANFLIGKPHVSGFNFAVKKKSFKQVGGMDTRYLMSFEVDLGLRLHKIGKVIFLKNLCVVTSNRRFGKDTLQALVEYTKGYIYTVWLRKPFYLKQGVIR